MTLMTDVSYILAITVVTGGSAILTDLLGSTTTDLSRTKTVSSTESPIVTIEEITSGV
jgi:hypothetical protein